MKHNEISLKDILAIILNRKIFISAFTLGLILLSIVYLTFKQEMYRVSALIQLGQYTVNNELHEIHNIFEIRYKLNYLFNKQYDNDVNTYIERIHIDKNAPELIELFILTKSNEDGIRKINKMLDYIRNEDKKIILDLSKIENRNIKRINNIIHEFEIYTNKFRKKDNFNLIVQYKNDKQFYMTKKLEFLEKLDSIKNFKQSRLFDRIVTNDNPVMPNKEKLLFTSFFGGLIISIFLVLLNHFYRNHYEEET